MTPIASLAVVLSLYGAAGNHPALARFVLSAPQPWIAGGGAGRPKRIYVANYGGGRVTTYLPNGLRTTPTFPNAHSAVGVAVSPDGSRIYVTCNQSVQTYDSNGNPTTPTFFVDLPNQLAVGPNGDIYVAEGGTSSVKTFDPQGNEIPPTITGVAPYGIAVDAHGKIYVANVSGTVTTYLPDGTPTTPTITGLGYLSGIAIGPTGKIYVLDNDANTEYTYDAKGNPSSPTIAGLVNPTGVAVDKRGRVYILNSGYGSHDSFEATYTSAGAPTSPTFKEGMYLVGGIAITYHI
jgi:sugar lactone lactonase YvrE